MLAERAACVAKALRSKVLDFGLGSDMLCSGSIAEDLEKL